MLSDGNGFHLRYTFDIPAGSVILAVTVNFLIPFTEDERSFFGIFITGPFLSPLGLRISGDNPLGFKFCRSSLSNGIR